MNIFRFKVKGFNHDNSYYFTNCGLGVCESYSDAARIIEDYFDDELISIEKIELFEDGESLIFLSESTVEEYSEKHFPCMDYQHRI